MHLVSVGSSKLLFSVYVSSSEVSTFYIQLSKPNAQHSDKKIPKLTRSSTEIAPDQISIRRKSPCVCTSLQRRRKSHKTSISPILSEETCKDEKEREYVKNRNAKLGDETQGLNVLSSTYHAVKSTHIAIRNSLSQFSMFSSTSNDEYFTLQLPIEVKDLKLPNKKWSHLSFSVMNNGSQIKVIFKSVHSYKTLANATFI